MGDPKLNSSCSEVMNHVCPSAGLNVCGALMRPENLPEAKTALQRFLQVKTLEEEKWRQKQPELIRYIESVLEENAQKGAKFSVSILYSLINEKLEYSFSSSRILTFVQHYYARLGFQIANSSDCNSGPSFSLSFENVL